MPEHSKRIAILGVKSAEGGFTRYVRERLTAERATPSLEADVAELERLAAGLERAVGEEAPGKTASFGELGAIEAALDRALGGLS